jgi:hypothetical protein
MRVGESPFPLDPHSVVAFLAPDSKPLACMVCAVPRLKHESGQTFAESSGDISFIDPKEVTNNTALYNP